MVVAVSQSNFIYGNRWWAERGLPGLVHRSDRSLGGPRTVTAQHFTAKTRSTGALLTGRPGFLSESDHIFKEGCCSERPCPPTVADSELWVKLPLSLGAMWPTVALQKASCPWSSW